MQSQESWGSGFETCSRVVPQATPSWCGQRLGHSGSKTLGPGLINDWLGDPSVYRIIENLDLVTCLQIFKFSEAQLQLKMRIPLEYAVSRILYSLVECNLWVLIGLRIESTTEKQGPRLGRHFERQLSFKARFSRSKLFIEHRIRSRLTFPSLRYLWAQKHELGNFIGISAGLPVIILIHQLKNQHSLEIP